MSDQATTSMVSDESLGAIRFDQVTATIGAVVHGVDVHQLHSQECADLLVTGLHEHGVLFFESDEPVEEAQFEAFAGLFGERHGDEYGRGDSASGVALIELDATPMGLYRTNQWHTDGSAMERPPAAALLTPLVLPSVGGDTMWASMYAAWDGLSSRYQRLLEGLEAVHSTTALFRYYPSGTDTSVFGPEHRAVHPVIVRDPITKRQAIYVNANWTERILDLSDRESRHTLQMLFDYVNVPEFQVRLRWKPNTIAVWEERVTQHRGVADFTGPRKLRRVAINGDRPQA